MFNIFIHANIGKNEWTLFYVKKVWLFPVFLIPFLPPSISLPPVLLVPIPSFPFFISFPLSVSQVFGVYSNNRY